MNRMGLVRARMNIIEHGMSIDLCLVVFGRDYQRLRKKLI